MSPSYLRVLVHSAAKESSEGGNQAEYLRSYDTNFNSQRSFTDETDFGDNGTGGFGQQGSNGGRDAYEFVAFLLWYLFLVLCCIIPTCCAYRRRRMVESRLAAQQASVNRIERQNVFILSALLPNHDNGASEQQMGHRSVIISKILEDTTMMVQGKDIFIPDEQRQTIETQTIDTQQKQLHEDTCSENNSSSQDNGNNHILTTFTNLSDYDTTSVLKLPDSTTCRCVPGACAICLGPYEVDDEVTWSTEQKCLHAFHKECIVPWLAKNDEPKCPCCRQDFCHVPQTQTTTLPMVSASSAGIPHHFSSAGILGTTGTGTLSTPTRMRVQPTLQPIPQTLSSYLSSATSSSSQVALSSTTQAPPTIEQPAQESIPSENYNTSATVNHNPASAAEEDEHHSLPTQIQDESETDDVEQQRVVEERSEQTSEHIDVLDDAAAVSLSPAVASDPPGSPVVIGRIPPQ